MKIEVAYILIMEIRIKTEKDIGTGTEIEIGIKTKQGREIVSITQRWGQSLKLRNIKICVL